MQRKLALITWCSLSAFGLFPTASMAASTATQHIAAPSDRCEACAVIEATVVSYDGTHLVIQTSNGTTLTPTLSPHLSTIGLVAVGAHVTVYERPAADGSLVVVGIRVLGSTGEPQAIPTTTSSDGGSPKPSGEHMMVLEATVVSFNGTQLVAAIRNYRTVTLSVAAHLSVVGGTITAGERVRLYVRSGSEGLRVVGVRVLDTSDVQQATETPTPSQPVATEVVAPVTSFAGTVQSYDGSHLVVTVDGATQTYPVAARVSIGSVNGPITTVPSGAKVHVYLRTSTSGTAEVVGIRVVA